MASIDCNGSPYCTLKSPGTVDDYYVRYYPFSSGYTFEAFAQGLGGSVCNNVYCSDIGYFCCSHRVGIYQFTYFVYVNNSNKCANTC